MGIYLLAAQPEKQAIGYVAIAYGIYMILRNPLYALFKARRTFRRFGDKPEVLQIDEDGFLRAKNDLEESDKIDLRKLKFYIKGELGLLLYFPDRNFIVLKADAFGDGQAEELESLLKSLDVPGKLI